MDDQSILSCIICPSPILATSKFLPIVQIKSFLKHQNKIMMKSHLVLHVESTILSPIVLNIGMSTVLTKLSDWSLFT